MVLCVMGFKEGSGVLSDFLILSRIAAELGPKSGGQGASAMKDEENKGWGLVLGESRDWGRSISGRRERVKAGAGQFLGAGKWRSLGLSETPPECQESSPRHRMVVEGATWGAVTHRNAQERFILCL